MTDGGSEESEKLPGWTLRRARGRGQRGSGAQAEQVAPPKAFLGHMLDGDRMASHPLVQSENHQRSPLQFSWEKCHVPAPQPPEGAGGLATPGSDQLLLKGVNFAVITQQAAESKIIIVAGVRDVALFF